ncbi:MAG: hypothetical protein OXF79_22035 [Chloroflexi bacterium]|nr:hypothetical protein [Chloroflexota bacterium]
MVRLLSIAACTTAIIALAWASAPIVEYAALVQADGISSCVTETNPHHPQRAQCLLHAIAYPPDHIPWWETYLKAAALRMDLALLACVYTATAVTSWLTAKMTALIYHSLQDYENRRPQATKPGHKPADADPGWRRNSE